MTIVHMDLSQRPLVVFFIIVTNAIVIGHSWPVFLMTTKLYIYIYIYII
jgi:hypothetical protein